MNQIAQQQLIEHIKRTVSRALAEVDFERFHNTVVTRVTLNNDHSEAKIWVSGDQSVIVVLNGKYRRELRQKFMKQYSRKVVPRLTFIPDDGSVDRMDELLEKL